MYQLSIDFLLLLSKSYLIPMIFFSLIKSFSIELLVQILKLLILSSVNADKLFVFNMAIDKNILIVHMHIIAPVCSILYV